MRFYLTTVQHNKEKNAENREATKAFDTLNQAKAAFHKQMGSDMTNATLDWAISIIFDEKGTIYQTERWDSDVVVAE